MTSSIHKAVSIHSDQTYKILVALLVVGVGTLVRYPYLVSEDAFPFGDGGLFVEMIYAIKANNYILPGYVNYNFHQIPFAYPPLGLYLALFWSIVLDVPVLAVVQVLPVVLNLLTIVCFVMLAAELTRDRMELLLSSGIFSILFQVYQWTAKGGGLSRSPGLLFTVLTIYLFLLFQKYGKKHWLVLAAATFGLVTVSHLEWALITAASLLVFIWFFKAYRTRQHLFDFLLFTVISAFVTMPWWGMVMYRFGMTPFINAWNVAEMGIGEFFQKLLAGGMFKVTLFSSGDYFLSLFGVIGFVSAFFSRRLLLLPIWLLACYMVAPKNSPISGLIPLVILIAIGLRHLDQVLLYLFRQVEAAFGRRLKFQLPHILKTSFSMSYLAVIMFIAIWHLFDRPILQTVSPVERNVMEFLEKNTPPDATFVVLTPYDWYSADAAEWFPYISKRQSLTTPQGLEFASASQFDSIVDQVGILSQMVRNEQAGRESGKLVAYIESNFDNYDFVAIFVDNVDSDFGGFLETGRYEVFYRKRGVLILQPVSGMY